ncbi:DsrE family protein [Halarcobacter sp.]|uniref:DsrE family protein n=1 Tax=Halarcobacter sp. TaxID=2321133 RepID=UPI002AAA9F8C|nr:DsrE family protein [Halarcobacter sp.]
MKKKNLLLIISTDNVDSILKFPLLYGGVSIPRGYWKRVHIMFWGASIKVAASKKKIRKEIKQMQKNGVEFSSCIVCAEEYGVVKSLEKIGITCNHTGELLNKALQNDKLWATLTI